MIELLEDPAAFDARAGAFIRERLAATVLATVLHGILQRGSADPAPRFALVSDGTGALTGAALQTPPFPLVCTELEPADATELADRWLQRFDPAAARVNGPPRGAREIAARWAQRSGRAERVRTAMALHVLETVIDPPRPAAGRLRPPEPAEVERVLDWELAFAREAKLRAPGPTVVELTRRRIAERRAWIWEDDGEPVSLVGHTPTIESTARVGPVYTPPEHRNRGYASSAVAAVSRRLLGAGAERVVLYTDLANPTSNRIYAEVGYRRIAGFEERELVG